jgi:hypothetical protein
MLSELAQASDRRPPLIDRLKTLVCQNTMLRYGILRPNT